MISPMTRLAIHHQSMVARTHADIAAALSRAQPDDPVSVRSVRRILSEAKPDLARVVKLLKSIGKTALCRVPVVVIQQSSKSFPCSPAVLPINCP